MIGPFSQVVTGLTMMMLPMTAGRIDQMSKPEKVKYLRRILAILVLVAGSYGCVLVLFGDLLVTLAFGAQMRPAVSLLPFAAAIALIWAIATPASLTLSAIKRPELLLVSFALATIGMLIAGPMLMHSLGRDGAMIGMILSWMVVAVTQWWFVARLL
jgi:O-antigen/teichoic acid export membrane protein